jgi:hypothetical protein
VESKLPSGKIETLYFEAESMLIHSIKSTAKSPQGEVEVTQLFDGYIDIAGVKFPRRMVIEQGPVVITMDKLEYKVNQEINDSEFKPE